MNFKACVQLPLYVDGVDSSINTQILKPPHDLLVHLEALENGRNPDIGTFKKEKGETFQNAAQRASDKNSCNIKMKSYFKWLKHT